MLFIFVVKIKIADFKHCTVDDDPNKRRFGCDVCGKKFTDADYLDRHMQVHMGKGPPSN